MTERVDRLRGLDGLRGLAACGVAFFVHFFQVGGVRDDGPMFGLFSWLYLNGDTLVDLFFVLSGYVICHACTHLSGRTFALRRFARLYPLHLATFAICAAILYAGRGLFGGLALDYEAGLIPGLLQMSLLHAVVTTDTFNFNAPSWSISIEFACYFLFALIARSRWVVGLAGLLILAGLFLPVTPWLARGLVGFFMGVILRREAAALSRIPSLVLAAVAALGIAVILLTGSFFVAALVAWPPVVLLTVRTGAFGVRPLVWLGDRSYGIYMLHTPIHLAMLLANGGEFYPQSAWLVVWLLAMGFTLLAADLSFRWLEVPAREAIRRGTYPWTRPAQPALS